MNLKTFNAQNAPHKVAPKVNRKLTFSFNSAGKFTIGRILHAKMGNPERVVILQDTQYPTDFYIRSSKDPMAFPVKAGSKNQFNFKSNTLASIISDALKITPPYTVKFKVEEKADGLFALGTRKPVVTKPSTK